MCHHLLFFLEKVMDYGFLIGDFVWLNFIDSSLKIYLRFLKIILLAVKMSSCCFDLGMIW